MPTRSCKQCGQTFEAQTTGRYCSPRCFKETERAYARRARKARSKFYRRAHEVVHEARNRGKLIQQPCEICGEKHSVAHHDDYAKPLDVRWLCLNHHQQWHRQHGRGANA